MTETPSRFAPYAVTQRPLSLFSEGTRIAVEIYEPMIAHSQAGLPAVLLCHGWGGVKAQLEPYARAFASHGIVAMTFDYRGWGDSDGRIIARRDEAPLLEAAERTLRVVVLREVVDPVDQTTDVRNCFAVLASMPGVDSSRLGIWGTSFGGGHAVYTAGCERRIRAVVAQIGGFGLPPEYHESARARAADKARGSIDPTVPQGGLDAVGGLLGTPDIARMAVHSPLDAAAEVRVPTLIIDAEHEQLFNRLDNGFAAYTIIRRHAPCEYRTFPCDHYALYHAFYDDAVGLAVDWFERYL